MKKLLIFISLFSSLFASAQKTPIQRAPESQPVKDGILYVTKGFAIPKVGTDSTLWLSGLKDSLGLVVQIRNTGLWYKRDTSAGTHKWTLIDGGGGGSSVWGAITGTLSDQLDLQAALNGKQNLITTGTVLQYLDGTLGLQTFPTTISTFTNDALYISSVQSQNSVTGTGLSAAKLQLVNDALAPGNSKYYGTDGSGTKGWFSISTPGTGTVISVGISVPTGLTATGTPVTSSGTLGFTLGVSGILRGNAGAFASTTISPPLTFSAGALGIQNSKADNTTKGAAAFNSTQFTDDGAGKISAIPDTIIATSPLVVSTNGDTISCPTCTAGSIGAFTQGSIPFMGTSLLVQDNANLFWDSIPKVLKLKNPSSYTNIVGTWSREENIRKKSTRGIETVDMVATSPTLFGQNWAMDGVVYRTKDANIAKNTSASFFGDSVVYAKTMHWGYPGSSHKYSLAAEHWMADTTGGITPVYQEYRAGHHAAGYFKYNTILAGAALDIGYQFNTNQFDLMTGTFNVDWNSEPWHFMNVVNYTPSTDAITGRYYPVYDASTKELRMNPAKALNNYQESEVGYVTTSTNTATGINAVVIGGQGNSVQQQYAFVAGGLNNRDTSIQSAIVGGRANISHGTNAFSVGDNIFIGGGYTNTVHCVDCAGVGGDHNILALTATGSTYSGGGANVITDQNSFIAASGNDSVKAKMSAIIANNQTGGGYSVIQTGADESFIGGGRQHLINGKGSVILGGQGLTASSYGETNVGSWNTTYSAASTTAINAADRAFDVGIGTGSGARADGLVVLKSGLTGFKNATPTSTVDIAGSFSASLRHITTNRTLDATDYTIYIDSGTPTVTLPAASTCTNRIYKIVNLTAGARTISSYNDFSGAAQTTIAANSGLGIQSDGTNWLKVP